MSSAVTSRASSSPSGSVASRSSVFNDLWKIRRFDQIQDPAESNDCTFSTMLLQPTQLSATEISFLEAARTNNFAQVQRIIDSRKIQIGAMNNLNRTALHLASANGHLEVVRILLNAKASIDAADKHGMTSLMWAAMCGHTEVVKALIDANASLKITNKLGLNVLHCVALNDQLNVLQLIARLINVNSLEINSTCQGGHTPLHLAAERGYTKLVDKLLSLKSDVTKKNQIGQTAIHLAAAGGHWDVIEAFVQHDINVNEPDEEGTTALMLAAAAGHADVIQCLLQNWEIDLNVTDKKGMTALMHAALNGHYSVTEALLYYGCDMDVQDEVKNTALHMAVSRDHLAVVKLLVAGKCDVTVVNKRKQTAMHMAVELGNPDVVSVLLSAGSRQLRIKDVNGKVPLMMAARADLPGIVDLIIKHDRLDMLLKRVVISQEEPPINDDGRIGDNNDDVVSAAESCQQHVEYVDDERQPSIANGSVRHLEVDHNESSLSGYKSDSRSMAASVRSTTASVRSTAASVRSTSGKQLPQQQQPSLDGDWMEKGNSSDTDVDDMRHRNCDADDDYNGGDCDTLASDVEHGAIQPVPSSASSQRDRYNSTGSFDDRDGTSGQHTPTRDDDAKSASTVVGSSTPASVQQMPATHTAEDVTDRTEVAMLPVGSGEVVFRKRVSVVAADGSLNTVTAVRVQQTAAAAAATAADTSSDAGIDATGAKFYSLPEKHTQPDFSSLVKLAGHIKQDYNMNEVDEEDDDSINDDEVFPIVEISVQGGVCKVRETIGRKSRVNVFTENDVAVVRRGSEETTKGAADADFDVIRHPETSDAMADEDNATRCDDGFDVDEREPGSGRGSMNGGLDHVLSSDDDVALPSAHIDVEAIVMSRNSDGASVEDIESAVRQDSLVGAALDDVQSVPDPDVDRQNDSGSEKSAEEPIDDDIDDAVAMARDVARRRRRDNQRRSQANEEEERMMSELLWKLAMKQLKPNDWKKLAKHWEFTDDHISAIQQQYTGTHSYRTHGFRLLTIWFHCQRQVAKFATDKTATSPQPSGSISIFGQLFEGLAAIDRRKLAEQIRKRCNQRAMERHRVASSCVVS